MIKINLTTDIESWYLEEIKKYFRRSRTYDYRDAERVISRSGLGISFNKLLLASPNELESIAKQIKRARPSTFSVDKVMLINMYERFRTSTSSKKLIEKINLKVCPYCNRNYIYNFKRKNSEETTAQLDHYFDKSKYPYLALSIYNLVPSCNVCNQRKSAKDVLIEPIFNPYQDNLHNHISFKGNKIRSLEVLSSKKLDFFSEERMQITIESKTTNNKINEHIKTFNIEKLYEKHKDIVAELFKKRVIYSDEYIDSLFEQYKGTIFKDKYELMRLITCGNVNDNEIHKRPLSKLIKDISQELGFL